MRKEEKASISIMKIICVAIILLLISGIGVMAVNSDFKDVKIILQNGYEMSVVTGKTTVSEVLTENNIMLEENQKTIPDLTEQIQDGQSIQITDKSYNEVQIAKISEEGVSTSLDELLQNYAPITEKIVVEQITIPYETVTKNTTGTTENTTNKVLQQGKDGLKEITYKVKYQNDKEIDKTVISEKVITEPVNKIVQVNKKVVVNTNNTTSRAASLPRSSGANSGGAVYKITAYCPCAKCCGKTNGRTAAGTKATAGRTVAASSKFAFGTKLNIGGHTYVVEDRGGAIKGNKIDIFVNSHSEALAWGVRYLPVSVIQ